MGMMKTTAHNHRRLRKCLRYRRYPLNVSTTDGLDTLHTTTDDNTFYSRDETRRIHFLPSSPSPPPSPPRKMNRKLESGMSFPKNGECRSIAAKPADEWFLQQREFQDRQLRTRNSTNNIEL